MSPQSEFPPDLDVGRTVRWKPSRSPSGLSFAALVVGKRWRYGTWDVQIVPLLGTGRLWTPLYAVTPDPEAAYLLGPRGLDNLEERAVLR